MRNHGVRLIYYKMYIYLLYFPQEETLYTISSFGTKMQLDQFFEKYLKKESLFMNKQVLQSAYVPTELLHRDQQVNQVANILAPALKMERPSNLFIYGKTGTGKTLTIKFITEKMLGVAEQQKIKLKIIYLNMSCRRIDVMADYLFSHGPIQENL